MTAKKKSARKSARKDAPKSVHDSAGPSLDSADPKERAEARREAAKAAPEPVGARPADPNAVAASPEEQQAVRDEKAKPDNRRPAAVPAAAPVAGISTIPAGSDRVLARDTSLAKVVDITPANKNLKGYREEEVVATRVGHYSLKRRRPGEVFTIGLVGNGYLPSWVRLAKDADTEPGVAQSRQVSRTATSQEIMDDVREDSGTETPLYLGGNQRRPTHGNPRTVV